MASEKHGRKAPCISGAGQRRRLSDITNVTMVHNPTRVPKISQEEMGDDSLGLEKEVESLKMLLMEKDAMIESKTRELEKLRLGYFHMSRRNAEIIHYNSQIYKDLSDARDKLKILQHESVQMAALYRASKAELQSKLTETLDKLSSLQENMVSQSNEEKQQQQQQPPPSLLMKLAQSRSNRIINAVDHIQEAALCNPTKSDDGETLISTRGRRRSSNKVSYKEPSLKVKLRREEMAQAKLARSSVKSGRNSKSPPPCVEGGESLADICEDEEVIDDHELTTTTSNIIEGGDSSSSSSSSFSSSSSKPITTETPLVIKGVEPKMRRPVVDDSSSSLHFSRRASSESGGGRPMRRSAEAVASYREPPLNTKMRRPE